jgi:fatty-acid desaturase
MLSEAIYELTLGKNGGKRAKILILFIGKFIVLALAITFGVQIMGNRIIIPILNYIIQIFVVALSFHRKV